MNCFYKSSSLLDINLPSQQYTIGVINSSVVHFQSKGASVYGLNLGVTKVQLLDNSIFSVKGEVNSGVRNNNSQKSLCNECYENYPE